MGYYSRANFNVRIRKDKIDEVKSIAEKICTKLDEVMNNQNKNALATEGSLPNWCWNFEQLEIEEDGSIYENDDSKHTGFEEFASFLAPYLEDGTIEIIGEDDAKWGFFIKKGKAYLMDWKPIIHKKMLKEVKLDKQTKQILALASL